MDYEENMVDTEDIDQETAADEDFTEDDLSEEEEEPAEDLDSLTDEEEEEVPAEEKQPRKQGTSEPGWFQSRWNKNVEKLSAQIRAEVRNEYEQQFAPIRDRLLEMDAKELVRQGEFKSIERAKEYLQLKQGIVPQAANDPQPAVQPRNDQGQFAPKEDPVIQAKIDMLAKQADKIKARTGVDVIEVFSNNPEIKNAVISGKMDFYDVAEQMNAKPAGRKPPAPMRSPNGASGQAAPNAIDTMSDEQFDRMERKIQQGARYKLT